MAANVFVPSENIVSGGFFAIRRYLSGVYPTWSVMYGSYPTVILSELSEADRHSERSDESPREAHPTESEPETTGTMSA